MKRFLNEQTILGAAILGLAGIVATVGLEVVRITSFRLGGMPGDLPRLMGVLLGVGFLASPVVTSMGIGSFGLGMPSMLVSVVLAHVAYGWARGALYLRWSRPAVADTTAPASRQQARPAIRPVVHVPELEGDRCA